MKKFDKTPTTLTKEPIAMTGAVVGFKYKDGVILAADTQGSYGSMARFKNITRIHRVAPTTAMATGGELSDFQEIKRILDEKHEHDLIQDDGTLFYQPHDYAHFLARKHYQRRNKGDPLWNNTVMGGVSSTGEKYLAVMDLFGNIIEGDHHVTGTGHYFCNVLIANNWREDMSFEEAKELVDNCFKVLFIFNCGSFRMRNKESIVSITSWVSLRLEKSIKVPERTFNIAVCLHLFETHLNQNFNELSSCFHEEMQISVFNFKSFSFWIEFLELLLLPRSICYHCACELCHKFSFNRSILFAFCDQKVGF